MDPETEQAAWAQLECEAQHYNETLANDPAYSRWLDQFNQTENEHAESE